MAGWVASLLLAAPVNLALGLHADGNTAGAAGVPITSVGNVAATLSADTLAAPVHLSGSYAPTLTVSNGVGFAVLHTLRMSAEGRMGQADLRATVWSTAGRQDFSPLVRSPVRVEGEPPPPPIDRLPGARFLTLLQGRGDLALRYRFSERLENATTVGASSSGGVGADAALLPRQNVATMADSILWHASRLDSLTVSTSGSCAVTAPPASAIQRTVVASAQLGWTRRFSPSTLGMLGAGVGATVDLMQRDRSFLLPAASASLSHAVPLRGQSLTFSLLAAAQPAVDPLTGLGYLQGSGSAVATWSPASWAVLRGSAMAERAMAGQLAQRWGATGELSATLQLDRRAGASIGFREAVLPVAAAGAAVAETREWSVFAGVTLGVQGAL